MSLKYLFFITLFCLNYSFAQQISPDTVGCAPLLVPLSGPNVNYENVYWDFGNGIQSSVDNPTSIYLDTGLYSVTLFVDYGSGVFDTLESFYVVQVVSHPQANFQFSELGNCESDNVINFQCFPQYVDSLVWEFGDGEVSNLLNPIHTYNSSGNFTPLLHLYNNEGCYTQISSDSLQIFPKVNINATHSNLSSCGMIDSLQFVFTGDFVSNFGHVDGLNFNNVDTLSISSQGISSDSLILIAENQYGCADTIVIQDFLPLNNAIPFAFDLHDGNPCLNQQLQIDIESSTLSIDSITWFVNSSFYSDTISCVMGITNANPIQVGAEIYFGSGCSVYIDTTIIPISASNYTGGVVYDSVVCANTQFQLFLDDSSYNRVDWIIDNNLIQDSDTLLTLLGLYGVNTIQANVYDSNSCLSILNISISVPHIEADLLVLNNTGCAPLSSTFLSTGIGGDQFGWVFGDGDTGSGMQIQHSYSGAGVYSPYLTVFDSQTGCSDTAIWQQSVTVQSNNVSVDSLIVESCGGYTLNIQNFNIGNGNWYWDYGDGSTSSSQDAFHVYTQPGVYEVSLTTNAVTGCQTSISGIAQITVLQPEVPELVLEFDCPNVQAYLTNNSNQNISWYLNDIYQETVDTFSFDGSIVGENAELFYSYTDTAGCLIENSVSMLVSCTDTMNVIIPADPGVVTGSLGLDTIHLCIDDFVNGFQFIEIPNGYNLIEFIPHYTESFSSFPSNYSFPESGFFQPKIIVMNNGVWDTLLVNQVFHVSDVIVNFNVDLLPQNCDSIIIHLNDSINSSQFVTWTVDGLGVWNNNSVLLPYGNQDFNVQIGYSVENSFGCKYEDSKTVTYSKLAYDPYFDNSLCLGDSALYYSDLSSTNYVHYWDFGDGNSMQNGSGFYQYNQPGTYIPYLVLDDDFGCLDTTVFDTILIINPYNEIVGLPNHICYNVPLQLGALNNADSYLWKIDGQVYSQDSICNYSYTGIEGYQIELISESKGCISVSVDSAAVSIPVVSVYQNQDRQCFPMDVDVQVVTGSQNQINWFQVGQNGNPIQGGTDSTILFQSENDPLIGIEIIDTIGCRKIVNTAPIQVWNQDYSVSDEEGCAPLQVEFVPPLGTVSSNWEFGLGTTDTNLIANPEFIQDGVYHLTASFIMDDGCVINIQDSNVVTVHDVFVSGTISVLNNCIPAQVEFAIDSSYNVNDYLWEYGNGATSDQPNSIHTFLNAGVYYPSITVENQFGCIDSLILQDSIFVSGGDPIASVSNFENCEGDSVYFELLNASFYNGIQWTLGDGNISNMDQFHHIYLIEGNYPIVLETVDSIGCSTLSLLTSEILISSYPSFSFSLNDSVYCLGDTLSYTLNNPELDSINWEFGNTSQWDPQQSFNTSGLIPLTVSSTNNGCATSFQDTLIVQTPVNLDILGDSSFCQQSTNTFLNVNIPGGVWAGQIVLDSVTGQIDISNQTVDTVNYSLNDVCNSTMNIVISVDSMVSSNFVLDSIQCEGAVSLGLVLDNPGGILLMDGQNLDTNNVDIFSPGVHSVSYQINNGMCSSVTSFSLYVNFIPEIDIETSKDIYCFNEQIDIVHSAPSNYLISYFALNLVNGDSLFDLSLVSSTAGNWSINYSIQDTNNCLSEYEIGSITVLNSQTPQPINVIRSTVVENNLIYTEWTIDSVDLNKYVDVNIFRTIEGTNNWTLIDQVSKYATSYEDFSADVFQESYEYRITGNFHCQWDQMPSESNSILLTKEEIGDYYQLKWNPYVKWDSGVDHYEVQTLINGVWETIHILPPTQFTIINP